VYIDGNEDEAFGTLAGCANLGRGQAHEALRLTVRLAKEKIEEARGDGTNNGYELSPVTVLCQKGFLQAAESDQDAGSRGERCVAVTCQTPQDHLLQPQRERLADSENSHHVQTFYEHHSDDRGRQCAYNEDGASNVLLADVGVETPTWEPLARTGTHNPRKR